MHKPIAAALAALALIASSQGYAKQESKPDSDDSHKEQAEKTPEPASSVTRHEVTIDGQVVKYTATAGWLIMKDAKDKPIARIGYSAYTRDGVKDLAHRPGCSRTTAARVRRPSGCTWGSSGPAASS